VRQFIFGVVVNVLRHIAVKRQEVLHVQRVSTRCPCRVALNQFAGQLSDLVILYTSEFLVLQPEITLDDLSRSQEPQDGNIAFC